MVTINLRGTEYPLLFSLNLQEKIQDRYGDVREITRKMMRYSEAKWLLAQAINEGFKYEEYMDGAPHREMPEDKLGVLTTFSDFQDGKIVSALLDALNESLGSDKKKLTRTDLEQQVLKMLGTAEN